MLIQMNPKIIEPAAQTLIDLRWGMFSDGMITEFLTAAQVTIPATEPARNLLIGDAIRYLNCTRDKSEFSVSIINSDLDGEQTLLRIQKVAQHAYNQALFAAQRV